MLCRLKVYFCRTMCFNILLYYINIIILLPELNNKMTYYIMVIGNSKLGKFGHLLKKKKMFLSTSNYLKHTNKIYVHNKIIMIVLEQNISVPIDNTVENVNFLVIITETHTS